MGRKKKINEVIDTLEVTVAENNPELVEFKERYDKFLENTKNTWTLTDKAKLSLSASMSMLSTKHGYYSKIPLICKGDNCPFKTTCQLHKHGLDPYGEPCPTEIAMILSLHEKYTNELQIEENDTVDQTLLRDLISYEIMLARCDARIAEEGDYIQMIDVGITENGDVIRKPELSQSVIFKEKIQKKKNEILQLLNSTRKDKSSTEVNMKITPTQILTDIVSKIDEFDSINIEGE